MGKRTSVSASIKRHKTFKRGKRRSKHLFCSKVASHDGKEAAVTDAQANAGRLQNLQKGKGKSHQQFPGSQMRRLPDEGGAAAFACVSLLEFMLLPKGRLESIFQAEFTREHIFM